MSKSEEPKSAYPLNPPIEDYLHSLEAAGAGETELTDIYGLSWKDNIRSFIQQHGLLAQKWADLNAYGDQKKNVVKFKKAKKKSKKSSQVFIDPKLKEAIREYIDSGLTGITVSEKYGGYGVDWPSAYTLSEMFHAANTSAALCGILAQDAMAALEKYASEDLLRMIAPGMVNGTSLATMLLTEGVAGSALQKMGSKAFRQEDGTYHLEGTKIFITYGEHDITENIIHLVLAKTEKGISLFVVPKFMIDENGNMLDKRNGIEAIDLYKKMGIHASPTLEMVMGGNKGPAVGYLVGEEGQGLLYMSEMMNKARLGVARQGIGLSWRAIEDARRYALSRAQGKARHSGEKDTILRHKNIEKDFLVAQARIMAMRMVCDHATVDMNNFEKTGDKNAKRRSDLFTPMLKSSCTDMAFDLTYKAMEIAGGMGFMKKQPFEQYHRDSCITPIYEGTNDIQADHLVFRLVAGDKAHNGAVMKKWIEDSLNELRSSGETNKITARTISALEDLQKATVHIIEEHQKNGHTAHAVSVMDEYLKLFANTAGGVMMHRSAKLAETMDNKKFAEKSKKLAKIYASEILPNNHGLFEKIMDPDSGITEDSPEFLFE